jgi:poly-gamma-glutamate capsule biosynthesis protein CapA/YwtB (metallophosphatase superfamily)
MKIRAMITVLLCLLLLCSCGGESKENKAQPLSSDSGSAVLAPVDIGNKTLSFIAAGDNIVHGNIYIDARQRNQDESREFDFLPMYDAVADVIENADIAFINQETIIGGESFRYSGYPRFNTPAAMGDALCELGFDVINIANNHMLDKGEKGLAHAIDYWGGKDVLLIGGYTKKDFRNIRILECDGVRIAYLAYTDWTNGLYLEHSSELYVPYVDDSLICEQIREAKTLADLVFVSIHWGTENEKEANAEQRRLAQLMCDSGADVIIGTHPHVLQSVEWLVGEGGNRTLVAYSLGNFMSTMQYGKNLVGGMLSFDIVFDSLGIRVENPCVIPVVTQYTMKNYTYDWLVKDINLYLLEDYTDELAMAHGCRYADKSFTLEWAKNYVKGAIDSDFLPDWLK